VSRDENNKGRGQFNRVDLREVLKADYCLGKKGKLKAGRWCQCSIEKVRFRGEGFLESLGVSLRVEVVGRRDKYFLHWIGSLRRRTSAPVQELLYIIKGKSREVEKTIT